jgi:hypothetical protein
MGHAHTHGTATIEEAVEMAQAAGLPESSYTISAQGRDVLYNTGGSAAADAYTAPSFGVRAMTDSGTPCDISTLRRPGWVASSYGPPYSIVGSANYPYLHETPSGVSPRCFLAPLVIDSPQLNLDTGKYIEHTSLIRVLNEEEGAILAGEGQGFFNLNVSDAAEAAAVGDELYELENWHEGDWFVALVDDDGPVGDLDVANWAKISRLKEQCFLLAHIKEFATFNQRLDPDYQWAGRWDLKSSKDKAVSVVQGATSNVVNLLTNNNVQQHWFGLTPDKISVLVPTISLFKIIEKPVDVFEEVDHRRVRTHTDICEKVIEIPFFNNPRDEMADAHNPRHPNNTLSFESMNNSTEFGRGLGGIKSFSWEYVGNNPVSARTDVNAKLELYFQKFEDIVRGRTLATFEDGIPRATGEEWHNWQYIDLALRSGDIGNEAQIVNGHPVAPYKLRAHVGWAVPPDFQPGMHDTDGIEFTFDEMRAIEQSFVTLYLTVVDHTFDIKDDSSVSFSIEYKAFIESTFGDPQRADILLTQDIANRRRHRQEQLEIARDSCSGEEVAEIKKKQAEEIDIEKSLAHETIINALEHHAGWVNGLPGPNPSTGYITSTPFIERSRRYSRIYQINIPENTHDEFLEAGPFEYGSATEWLQTALGSGGAVVSAGDVTAQISDRITAAGGFDTSDLNTSLEKLTGFTGTVESSDAARNFNLQWFYFGDLIHVAMERLEENAGLLYVPPAGYFNAGGADTSGGGADQIYKSRIVLGPFDVVDPLTDEIFQVNLADIPISVNYFIDWFMQKIISKQEASYPLMSFIREALNDLVIRTMNDAEFCFGGATRQKAVYNSNYLIGKGVTRHFHDGALGNAGTMIDQLQQFEDWTNNYYVGYNMVGIRTSWGGTAAPPTGIVSDGFPQHRLYTNLVSDANLTSANCSNPLLATFREDMEEIGHTICDDLYYKYAIITLANGHMPDLRGNKAEDMENNILWFHIGSPSGPVKSMKFNKTDMKGVKEARFFREGFNGLAQLREPYDVNISCYGQARIFPGQMIYVDPIGMGTGMGSPSDLNSIAYLLGFGGYHQVIKVKNTIKAGDYTTDIEAKWVSTGNAADPRRGTLIGETSPGSCSVNPSDFGLDPTMPPDDGGPWPVSPAERELPMSDHEELLIGNDGSLDAEDDAADAAHDQAFTEARMTF